MRKGRLRHAGTQGQWGWKISGEYQEARDFVVVETFYNGDSTIVVTDDPDFDAESLRANGGLFYYPDEKSRLGVQLGSSRVQLVDLLDGGRIWFGNGRTNVQQAFYESPRFYVNLYRSDTENGDTFAIHNRARYMVAGFSREEAQEKARFPGHFRDLGFEARYRFSSPTLRSCFTAGVDFRQYRQDSSPVIKGGDLALERAGFYGHSETDLHERLKLVLATRFDFSEEYDRQISPKAALIYKTGTGQALRLSVDRAFRSPNVVQQRLYFPLGNGQVMRGNLNGFRFGTASGDPLPAAYTRGIARLGPEENTNVEVGFRGVVAQKLFLDLTAHRSRYRNFISPFLPIGDPDNGIFILDENGAPRLGEGTLTYLNFGERTVWGLDLDAEIYATEKLVLRGNFSLLEPGTLEGAGDLSQPFNTPKTRLNLGLSTRNWLRRGTLADLNLRRVSKYDFRSGVHQGTVPAYAVLDLNLSYETERHITYRAAINNVFDNEHIEVIDAAKIGRIAVIEIQYAL